ncbi:hypothetical protein LCGC14_1644280 [marine sediment metagenome]|uniref:DUF1064 domain-containing protein n=1 Tax=marine sediment metagenome TaxID=412755 RepID=A0A0F9KEM2_9ZZZZ
MKQYFKKHKFNAIRTEYKGVKYHSKKEARYAYELDIEIATGKLLFFLRQVPFYLPGNTKYVLDFMEFWVNGDIKFCDVKGRDTPMSILKRKQVEALYPIKIELK